MNGFFLIDKKEGWTSRDVVTKISHIFHIKKVGHSGTLDPFATGLLLVSIGNATKTNICVEGLDKEYIATLKLGSKTLSGDKTNEVVETKPITYPTKKQIEEVFKGLLGPQKQTPPMVSAVRYKGQKLFHLALQGVEVDRPSRDINIYELELLKYEGDEIAFRAKVSKGTYIRTLGEEIAKRLNNLGHLTSLRRTKVGPFSAEDAIDTLDVSEDKLLSMYDVLSKTCEVVVMNDKDAYHASHGVIFKDDISDNRDTIVIADRNHRIMAIYKYKDGQFICQRGIEEWK